MSSSATRRPATARPATGRRSKLLAIVRMEFRMTAATKAFIVLTILGPFLIAAVTVLPTLMTMGRAAGGGSATKVAFVGPTPGFVAGIAPALASAGIAATSVDEPIAAMDAAVQAGAWDAYVVLPADPSTATVIQMVSRSATDVKAQGALQGIIGQAVVTERLTKAGIPASEVAALTAVPGFQLRQVTASGEKKSADFVTALLSGLMLAMLLYMTVLLYGQMIGRSVLQEKTAKTVEIMLSSVRPLELMWGKILGKAAASLLQYAVWIAISTAVLGLLRPLLGITLDLGISAGSLGWLLLFFLLAFFLYCSVYAGMGAASEDEQHLGQLAWPIIVFLVIPVVMISPIITSPNAPLVVGLSLFPLTAPIVMFLRITVGSVPWEQQAASIVLILGAVAGAVALSARIFRVAILMTGKRRRFAEVLRLARPR